MIETILASSSPRRKELLGLLGFDFKVVKPDVLEQVLAGESPRQYVQRNATIKAEYVYKLHPEAHVISADTVVVLGDRILEKPSDRSDAREMLTGLSGRQHQVLTGFCIKNQRLEQLKCVVTDVTFRELRDQEIENYIATDEPYDKAGSYAAQGMGSCFIQSISGSYTNVVGLPMAEVAEVLQSDFSYPEFFATRL